jgi:hypothetical protein
MSRQSLSYATDVERAAEFIAATSEAHIRHVTSMYAMSTAERRENLLALAVAFHKANAPADLRPHVAVAVRYHALASDPMPAWGRLLVAVRENDADEVDAALDRLVTA